MTQSFGPYTPVRKAGNFYFVSGQIGIDPATKTASDKIYDQTNQVLMNMRDILGEQGLTMEDVVKTTIFVTNIDDFKVVNTVYEQFFNQPRPARSTVQISELPKVAGDVKLLVEIEAVVYKEQD